MQTALLRSRTSRRGRLLMQMVYGEIEVDIARQRKLKPTARHEIRPEDEHSMPQPQPAPLSPQVVEPSQNRLAAELLA